MPYISLTPLFHACGLSLIQGLIRFRLPPSAFSLSLAGLEPWDDLWISLALARRLASQLDLFPSLSALLDDKTTAAWSLDEFAQGISHNWRIPQQYIDAAAYSTDAITNAGLEWWSLQLLPRGQQINTLVSKELRARIVRAETRERKATDRLISVKLVRWTAATWELYSSYMGVMEIESEEERRIRAREMAEDLRGVVIQPTQLDVLEWMQLVAPLKDEGLPDREALLLLFSNAELADMRNGLRPDELDEALDDGDPESILAKVGLLLRVKMRLMHSMNLLTLSLPSSSHPTGPEPKEPLQTEDVPKKDAVPLPATNPADETTTDTDQQLAMLNAKVDILTAKLDMLLHKPSSRNCRAANQDSTQDASLRQLFDVPIVRNRGLAIFCFSIAAVVIAFCIAILTFAFSS